MATDEVKVRLRVELATVTEREAVLRERAAFSDGARALYFDEGVPSGDPIVEALHRVEDAAPTRYPLPKVKRPRVVTDHEGDDWRWVEGRGLEIRRRGCTSWVTGRDYVFAGHKIRALLADLLANPVEEVEA